MLTLSKFYTSGEPILLHVNIKVFYHVLITSYAYLTMCLSKHVLIYLLNVNSTTMENLLIFSIDKQIFHGLLSVDFEQLSGQVVKFLSRKDS